MNTSDVEQRLAVVMAEIPLLHNHGVGVFDTNTQEEDVYLAAARKELCSNVDKIKATLVWLSEYALPASKAGRHRISSYGWKHLVEADIGYISNGVFIAAAILAGYDYQISSNSPNVLFKMGLRDSSPHAMLCRYGELAMTILAGRGLQPYLAARSADKNELVWSEGGRLRTLKIDFSDEQHPRLMRLHVDHHSFLVSMPKARALGCDHPLIHPSGPKCEITLLPAQVEAGLQWVLSHDLIADALPSSAPFELCVGQQRSYVWSRRASDAYARSRGTAPCAPE